MGREHGDIHWSELMTRDGEAAAAFYERAIGWRFDSMTMPDGGVYRVAMKGETPVAGIFQMDRSDFEGMPPRWMTYIAVDDIDATMTKVEAAGGGIMREPFDVAGVGRIAIVTDSTGATIGMITPAAAQG